MKSNSEDKSLMLRKRAGNHVAVRVVKWLSIALGVIIAIPLLLLVVLTLWLTPDRLTELVNKEGSRYLEANIRAKDVRYTLWSTFPRFHITTGPIELTSRTLDNIPADIRRQLPDSAAFLGSLNSFSGEINAVDLFMNRYVIHDVSVDGLTLNFVAYNDSINNYNIIPSSSSGFKRVPYFSANKVEFKNPGEMRYRSVATNTTASLQLQSLLLTRDKGRKVKPNSYRLELGGTVTAASAGLRILHNFPFSLGGDMRLRFDPFGVAIEDYSIDLGEIKSKLSMSVGIGNDPKLESFNYRISSVSLMGLLGYLPKEFVPSLQGLQADMPVEASARLLSAWSFTSESFPSIAVDFKVPAGTIQYTLSLPSGSNGSRSATYSLRHSDIAAEFIFDGKNPDASYIQVNDFNVASSGLNLEVGGRITDLTGRPEVVAALDMRADVAQSLSLLPFAPPVEASGNIDLSSNISFRLAGLSKSAFESGLEDLMLTADIKANDIAVKAPQLGLTGTTGRLEVSIAEKSQQFNSDGIENPSVSISGKLASTNLSLPGKSTLKAGSVSFSTATGYGGRLTPSTLEKVLPLDVNVDIANLKYADPASATQVVAENIRLTDHLSGYNGDARKTFFSDGLEVSSPDLVVFSGSDRVRFQNLAMTGNMEFSNPDNPAINVSVQAPSIKYDSPKASLNMLGINFAGRVSERSATSSRSISSAPAGKEAYAQQVAALAASLPHTPELIKADLPQGVRNFLNKYSLQAKLLANKIGITTAGFRKDNYLANINLDIDDDEINLAGIDALLRNTRAHASARVSNLRNFLLRPSSASNPLMVDLELDMDTVNINALARAYVESKGGMDNIPRHDKVTSSDSIALLVPKNLLANIHFGAKETVYTNLHLFDLDADVKLHDGIADITNLGLASSFGRASLNVVYDSSDIEALALKMGVNVDEIDIVKFFKKFHALLEMMPEMKNLKGTISAQAQLSGDIFPDMYINMPSAVVDLNVQGRGLNVHQSKFIRKITKMMLIRTDDNIHIHDLNVHARIHDNLLQLDPFNFEFDRYRLNMLGVNNFNGDLYYHIAVDKSPVPFPFSVNIEGVFRHPKLRFGGGHYDTAHAERITSNIQEENNINMVLILRKFLRAFIGKAAESSE